jgi:hypothetical protein
MRARAGFLGGILVLLIGAGVAGLAYQAGLSQAATTTVAAGTAAAPVVMYPGWGFGFAGFHLFGILFGLLFLFVMARIVFGLLFWRGPRHWGERGEWGARHMGPMGATGPMGRRGDRFMEFHRWLHEQEQAQAQGRPGTPPTATEPPTDDRPAS